MAVGNFQSHSLSNLVFTKASNQNMLTNTRERALYLHLNDGNEEQPLVSYVMNIEKKTYIFSTHKLC